MSEWTAESVAQHAVSALDTIRRQAARITELEADVAERSAAFEDAVLVANAEKQKRHDVEAERNGYASAIEQATLRLRSLEERTGGWPQEVAEAHGLLASADTSTVVQAIRDKAFEEAAMLAENVEPIVNDSVMEGHAKNIGMVLSKAIRAQRGK